MSQPGFPQSDYWPAELAVTDTTGTSSADSDSMPGSSSDSIPKTGQATPVESDSTALWLSSEVSLYQTFKTGNSLGFERRLPWGSFTQSVVYGYQQLDVKSSIQYLDFSGNVTRQEFPMRGMGAGIEWAPIVSYSRCSTGVVESNVDIGPFITHTLFTVPYAVRGGLYGYAWNSSIESLSSTPLDSYHGDPGVYGSCSIGNPSRKIMSLPLFLTIEAQGRAIRGNNIGRFRGSVLYADEFPFFGGGDSLFLHLGDSITNGKELFIGSVGGKSFFSPTSWRINHTLSASAGFKMKERLGMLPRWYYQWYLHSISYPSNVSSLDDIRTAGQLFGLGLQTKEDRKLWYSGGIEFKWEFEDWLFRRRVADDATLTDENVDALMANLNDHRSVIARSDHKVRLHLPLRLTAEYDMGATKDSKRYTFSYMDSSAVRKMNQNENDNVQIDQKVSLRFDGRDSLYFITLYGRYGKLYDYFYRALRSADSRQTREYRIGLEAGCSAGQFEVREHLYGDAEVADYYFKKIEGVPNKAPPYDRVVSSTLNGKWKIREDRMNLIGAWTEIYNDNGYWYGRAYWPDSSDITEEYYAIDRKAIQYWIDLSLETIFESCSLTVGIWFQDVFQREFDAKNRDYIVSRLDQGYGIEPYLRFVWRPRLCLFKFTVRRNFLTRDAERLNWKKNWELTSVLEMLF
ncbi:MAG: hypothetical protein JW913_18880 [Chitinispirillaceae bacterium]|nr:hypothetical protein [Chitinispirillaceae bacterium]